MKRFFSPIRRVLVPLALGTAIPASGHNLDTTATSISFADDYVALMSQCGGR